MPVGQEHSVNNPFTADEIDLALHAMAAWAGNGAQTSRYLRAEKDLDISASTLNHWKVLHGPRYNEIRDQHQAEIDKTLGHEFRENAALALRAERLAVEKAHVALEEDREKDPARAAANLARVAQSNAEKALMIEGRPTRITENRGVDELLRSLAGMGILKLPAGEVEESDVQ